MTHHPPYSPAPRHIVVGTDFSNSSRGAVAEAMRLARRFGATLSVVNVEAKQANAKPDVLAEFVRSCAPPPQLDVREEIVVDGSVAGALARFVASVNADLLVVGPRAHGFIERHIVGGIAEQLVSKTACPTLATSASPSRGYERVIVAVDGSDAAAHALQLAAHFVEDTDVGKVVLLHALAGRGASALHATLDVQEIENAMVKEAQQWISQWSTRTLGELPAHVYVRVEIGTLGHVLEQVARTLDADLVCMGTVGRKGIAGVLAGNAAERMVRKLGIPLLVAHP